MRVLRLFSLFFVLLLGVAAQNCGGVKKITVRGFVIYADSTLAPGAAVRTDPLSESVTSNTDGSFTISEGLAPGVYDFIAEIEGREGRMKVPLQYSKKNQNIFIKIGATLEMTPLQLGEKWVPTVSKGKKR